MRRLRILTWHVHGSYLEALGRTGHELVVPVKPGRPPRYGGRPPGVDWPDSIVEVPAEVVRDLDVDLVLYQHELNWTVDQHEILSESQLAGPRIFLEHDPPRRHPTDTVHPVDDPDVLLVHCTAFNALMWDSRRTPTRVIDHGVDVPPELAATVELDRGIVVVNDLPTRGRRLGADLVEAARAVVPLDLYGLRSEAVGGLGELPRRRLLEAERRYRFYFHPARYTSLGLGVIEAMLLGLPVVGLATTELPTVIEHGISGVIDTEPTRLFEAMRELIADPELARQLGRNGRRVARERFGIERFVRDWDATFREVAGVPAASAARPTLLASLRPRPVPAAPTGRPSPGERPARRPRLVELSR